MGGGSNAIIYLDPILRNNNFKVSNLNKLEMGRNMQRIKKEDFGIGVTNTILYTFAMEIRINTINK